MSDRPSALNRRWPLRLLQASPLAALMLFAVVWFSVPTYYAVQLMSTAFTQNGFAVTPEMRAEWVDMESQANVALGAGLWGADDSLDVQVNETYKNLIDRQGDYVSTASVSPLPFAADDQVYEPVVAWEARTGARVWAWVMLQDGVSAPVVASATGDQETIDSVQREIDSYPTELSDGMAKPKTVLEFYTNSPMPMGAMEPVDPTKFVSSGGGSGSDEYMFGDSSVFAGGEVWRVVTLARPDFKPGEGYATEAPEDLQGADPREAGYNELLQRLATRDGINIWVIGPLRSRVVPLRAPGGGSVADSEKLGNLVWPDVYARMGNAYSSVPVSLPQDVQQLAQGEAGSIVPMSVYASDVGGSGTYMTDEIAPQTVVFFAVFDEMPGGEPGLIGSVWLAWKRFVAGWFPWLIGASVGLMAISLVASPAAFVVERRLRARALVLEDMARMQRDAHDKVYNRLSALSKRVAEAGDEAQAGVSRPLNTIAEDIRGTVGELQEILGEQVHRSGEGLTTQSLKAQIESVCVAQGVRLDVEMDCWLSDDLPTVSPRFGWDLQCIVEEAITNAVRHGSATQVRVTMAGKPGGPLVLTVADNGSGSAVLSPDDAHEDSTGLRGMRDRVAARGGTVVLEAGEHGTSVVVSIPTLETGP